MDVRTREQGYRRWLAANDTSASFPSRIPTLTPPSGSAGELTDATRLMATAPNIVRVDPLGADTLELLLYGVGDENTNFVCRVLGWRCIGNLSATTVPLWIPVSLATLACTIGTAEGVATTEVGAAQSFVDTITVTDGLAGVPSVATNLIAPAFVSLSGFMGFSLIFNMNSSATSGNALFTLY